MDEQKHYRMEELRSAFFSAPCAVGIFNAQTREPLFLNAAYYGLVGYSSDEYDTLISNEDQKLIFPADLPINRSNTEQFSKTGNVSNIQFRIVRRNGEVRWVDLCMTPIVVDDVNCALSFLEDITAEKEHLTQLRLLAESIGSSICVMRIKDGKEQLLYANETFFKLIGIDRERYLKDTATFDYAFTSDDDRAKTHGAIQESIRTGKPQELTYRFLRPDSSPLWMNRRLSVVSEDEENAYLMVSIATDITEKKERELAIALEQRRYELVISEMKAAVFEWNLETGDFYSSEGYKEYAMSEVPPAVVLANEGPADVIHPDDTQAMMRFFSGTDSGAHRVETSLRLKLTEGGYRWCKLVGLFYKDEDGHPTRTLGMIIDIDEEKEKSFMLDSLLNELPGGVAVFKVGEKLECQYFNDGFAELSNRTREELDVLLQSGQLVESVIAQPDKESFIERVKTAVVSGEQLNLSYRFLTKQGELRWLHMNASKLREEDGCPVYYCVFTTPSEETTLYRSIVEDSTTGAFVAERATRRIVYCNEIMRQFFDIAPGTPIIGRLASDVISKENILLTTGEVAALSTNRYAEYHRSHEDRYLGIRAKALRWNDVDSYILYVSDETQEHSKRLQQDELLNMVPVGIGVYEIECGIIEQLYMNDGYYRMVGQARESRKKEQKNFLNLVCPDDLSEIRAVVERCAAGSQQETVDHRILCGNGEYRWFRLVASVVKREGDRIKLYCSYADIDDTVKAQKALENANREIQKRYDQEVSRRKLLEKGSVVAVQFNVTQDRLISDQVHQGPFAKVDAGTAGNVIRPDIADRIPTEEERRIAADFYDRDKALVRFHNGIKEFSVKYRRRLDDGRLYWLNAICRLERDEESGDVISYTYIRDIDTERKKELAAESVIDEETDFVMLLNTVSNTAMLLRVRDDYQDLPCRLYEELPFTHAIDMGQVDSVEPEDKELVLAFFKEETLVERLKEESVVMIAYRHRSPDGAVRRKKTRAFYLDGTHEDIVIARRDITDLYEEEQEQKHALEKALTEATDANRAKSDFLSRMSHDLRTPMNVIIGLASLAMDYTDDPKEMENALSNITNSSRYLLSLVNDSLDLEKINSGKIELHPAPYPYIDFYNDIKAVIEPMCRQKNITLVMEENYEGYPVVIADKTRIEQIFYNLLSNAVKFTPNGGTVEMLTQNIVVKDGISSYEHIVRDDGIGMSEEFQKHMFETFTQEQNDMMPEYYGTGLGLAIVKQLIELMGATVTVKSELGVGTEYRIHFRFPVMPESGEAKKEKEPVLTDSLHGKRVLLVEDHPLNRMIALKILEKAGMMVTETENGHDAFERFKSVSEGFYDAILMDIRMPLMNGLEATRAIRALERADAKTIPIIAMTANAFDTDIEKSMEAGMNAHLSKPIEPHELYETLTRLIG